MLMYRVLTFVQCVGNKVMVLMYIAVHFSSVCWEQGNEMPIKIVFTFRCSMTKDT